MKKPIKVAAVSSIINIILPIILIMCSIVWFIVFKNLYFAYAMILNLPFVVLFYYGFVVLGRKFHAPLLKGISWYFIITSIIFYILMLVAIFFANQYIVPKITDQFDSIIQSSTTKTLEKNKKAFVDDTAKLNNIEGIEVKEITNNITDPNSKVDKKIMLAVDVINTFNLTKYQHLKTTIFIIAIILILMTTVPIILLGFGILQIAKYSVVYAKTTGVITIIVGIGTSINYLLGLIGASMLFSSVINGAESLPLAYITLLSIVQIPFGMIASWGGLAMGIFIIVLLFRASKDFEKPQTVNQDTPQK